MQFVLTPAAGKRLIAKAVAQHETVRHALRQGTLVIVAGTTNGYVAEEILTAAGLADGFTRNRFFRGITMPGPAARRGAGRSEEPGPFPGDLVLVRGEWQQAKEIFHVVDDLREGDLILKGANAINLERRQAGILIGHPKAGTIGAALQVVTGKRVGLMLPVGLEKRVTADLFAVAAKLNAAGFQGPRLLPVPGQIMTELDAVKSLTGADAELTAAGGVCGAEGAVWLAISGTVDQCKSAEALLHAVAEEPPFAW
jgi:hypothetical protein